MADTPQEALRDALYYTLLAALTEAEAERDRLRLAFEVLRERLLHPARSYTPHELAMDAVEYIDDHLPARAALRGEGG